jgi:proteasome lid subunit RPN8/RPN11
MMVTIAQSDLDSILAHVRSEMPREACGLLGGVGGCVRAVFPIPNVADDPGISFRMDGKAQLAAMSEIEEKGWELLAIYHSHPCGALSEPSPRDVDQAYYPEALTIIVAADLSVRAFVIRGGEVSPVPLTVT